MLCPKTVVQQVQLRVSNDEPHRVFCLSWLKATYEPCAGKSIEQNIMYKQYLASMHRMGRKEVISAQHYALCIRTLFGGSTGPNKKTVGEKVENHYTGIQVRAQPLPLKLTPAQAAAAQEASKQQNSAGPAVVQSNGVGGAVVQPQQQAKLAVTPQAGQQLVLNSAGQLVNSAGQVLSTGLVQQVGQGGKLVQVSSGQQIIVSSAGPQQQQQVIQVRPFIMFGILNVNNFDHGLIIKLHCR